MRSVCIYNVLSLHQKCSYLELFWSVFFRIRSEYGETHIQSECGKMRTRITPNTDTYAVLVSVGEYF